VIEHGEAGGGKAWQELGGQGRISRGGAGSSKVL